MRNNSEIGDNDESGEEGENDEDGSSDEFDGQEEDGEGGPQDDLELAWEVRFRLFFTLRRPENFRSPC